MLATILLSFSANAELRIEPSLTLSEEYNDNILLDNENNYEEYISRITPAFNLRYKVPRIALDVDYSFEYRYYAKYNTYPGGRQDEAVHGLDAQGGLEIAKDLLFLNVTDSYQRVSLSAERDFTQDSPVVNQSDRNILTVNPYFIVRQFSPLSFVTGYRYEKTDYKDPEGIDSTRDIVHADIKCDLSPKSAVGVGYAYTKEESDISTYAKNDVFAVALHQFAEKSKVFAKFGTSYLDFEEGERYSELYWQGVVSYVLDRWSLTADSGRDYSYNPTGNPLREDYYRILIGREDGRAELNLLIYLYDYWDTGIQALDTRNYGTDWHISYEVTPRMTTSFNFTIEKYEKKLIDTYTRRYFAGISIDYSISNSLYLSVLYRYVDSESPDIQIDNYYNNRVIIGLRKNFYGIKPPYPTKLLKEGLKIHIPQIYQ